MEHQTIVTTLKYNSTQLKSIASLPQKVIIRNIVWNNGELSRYNTIIYAENRIRVVLSERMNKLQESLWFIKWKW